LLSSGQSNTAPLKGKLFEKAYGRNVIPCDSGDYFCEKPIIIVRIQIKLDIILDSGYNGFMRAFTCCQALNDLEIRKKRFAFKWITKFLMSAICLFCME